MTAPNALKNSPLQQALALALAAVLTVGVMAGLLGLAGSDASAQLAARQGLQGPQVQATVPAALPAPAA